MENSEPVDPLTPQARAGSRRLGLAWGGAVLTLLLIAPWGGWLTSWLWSCPTKRLFGIPCPTCGLTRAALALSRFEVVEALVRFPLQTLAWGVFLAGGTVAGVLALLGRPLPKLKEPPRWAKILAIVAVLCNWFYGIFTGI